MGFLFITLKVLTFGRHKLLLGRHLIPKLILQILICLLNLRPECLHLRLQHGILILADHDLMLLLGEPLPHFLHLIFKLLLHTNLEIYPLIHKLHILLQLFIFVEAHLELRVQLL